jgi:hypothetical protein
MLGPTGKVFRVKGAAMSKGQVGQTVQDASCGQSIDACRKREQSAQAN